MYTKEIVATNTNNGYLYFMDKTHPLADKIGRVYYHRHVASIARGRWLTSDEQVHHIDEVKLNNDPQNLQVLTSSEHAIIHKGSILERQCLHCNTLFTPVGNSILCCSSTCGKANRVKDKSLTKEQLDALIPTHSWVKLGKMFGYSDNGIKKRARALGCTIPTRKKNADKVLMDTR
jgi:hypothetical protein